MKFLNYKVWECLASAVTLWTKLLWHIIIMFVWDILISRMTNIYYVIIVLIFMYRWMCMFSWTSCLHTSCVGGEASRGGVLACVWVAGGAGRCIRRVYTIVPNKVCSKLRDSILYCYDTFLISSSFVHVILCVVRWPLLQWTK